MIKKDFNAVYRSINNISLRQFPAETLQKMYENYSVNQQKLFDEIKKIKKTQKEKLDTHDGLEVENLRKNPRNYSLSLMKLKMKNPEYGKRSRNAY